MTVALSGVARENVLTLSCSFVQDSEPNYRYAYGVEDNDSGDIKHVTESRQGINTQVRSTQKSHCWTFHTCVRLPSTAVRAGRAAYLPANFR